MAPRDRGELLPATSRLPASTKSPPAARLGDRLTGGLGLALLGAWHRGTRPHAHRALSPFAADLIRTPDLITSYSDRVASHGFSPAQTLAGSSLAPAMGYVQVLGAGGYAGKSCLLVELGELRVLLDCGVKVSETDDTRYPDFSLMRPGSIDAVIVTHYHLDHIGALPYLFGHTSLLRGDSRIYMSAPTKAIGRMAIDEFVEVNKALQSRGTFASTSHVDSAFTRVTILELDVKTDIGKGVSVQAYRAGHALGGVMVWLRSVHGSLFYTGDFCTEPERHLDSAQFPSLNDGRSPDMLVSECLYGASVHATRRSMEFQFAQAVLETLHRGGKVLVPVTALGRCQEISCVLDDIWERYGLSSRILVWSDFACRVTREYAKHPDWLSHHVREVATPNEQPFTFRHVEQVTSTAARAALLGAEPLVVITCPSAIRGGGSSQLAFDILRHDSRSLVFTNTDRGLAEGSKAVLSQTPREDLPAGEVLCKIARLPFGAHTDGRGVRKLVERLSPKKLALVHGDERNSAPLLNWAATELGIPCSAPKDGDVLEIESERGSKPDIFVPEDVEKGFDPRPLIDGYRSAVKFDG